MNPSRNDPSLSTTTRTVYARTQDVPTALASRDGFTVSHEPCAEFRVPLSETVRWAHTRSGPVRVRTTYRRTGERTPPHRPDTLSARLTFAS